MTTGPNSVVFQDVRFNVTVIGHSCEGNLEDRRGRGIAQQGASAEDKLANRSARS